MTLSCEAIQDLLIDYHYGELDDAEARAVAAHLGSCADCALESCRLHADLAGLSDALADEPGAHVHEALKERVATRFPERWWRRAARLFALRIPAYQAVAVCACLIGLWFVFDTTPAGPVRPALEPVPATPVTFTAPTVVPDYDASTIVSLDPNVL